MDIQITSEDKRALRDFTKNLPEYHRRYKNGKRVGQFIFETRRVRGDKAKQLGFDTDANKKPFDPKSYYLLPTSPVMMKPYDFFLNRIKELNAPVDEKLLTAIYDEYMVEVDETNRELSRLKSQLETSSSKE